jgi:hypothetical protein
LVVFENHVIIFSDKDCKFHQTENPILDWSRWFRRAVLKSADQVWGAERWIKSYPRRLFLDRPCSRPFPLELPDPATTKFHRIVVAHAASRRCREALGGSGSFMIWPSVIGPMHYQGEDVVPFAIGQVDPSRGYVHVFDDTSLDIVLRTLDTITDFVNYLAKKERLVESGRLIAAAGEEDLLAYYLQKLNERGEHDFTIPEGYHGITIDEGLWEEFRGSQERAAQIKANEISYLWDRMIERFSHHLLAGTSLGSPGATVSDHEKIFRFMARESRLRRRLLAKAVTGLIEKAPPYRPSFRATRVVVPSLPGDPYYVLLLLTGPERESQERYRLARRNLLEVMCMVTKLQFPDALDIIGYATEPGPTAGSTEDALYFNARDWDDELQAEAQGYRDKLGLLTKFDSFSETVREYPTESIRQSQPLDRGPKRHPRSMRNSPCPCGSGKKYKKCCLGRGRT